MTQLYLVRHGQTDWNVEGRYQGQSDLPLNAAGRAQVERLSQELAEVPFCAAYSSDLSRARETARLLAAPRGIAVYLDPRLREISLGVWEGQLVTEIARQYPEAWAERRRDPARARAPGGESVAEVGVRVGEAADAIASAHPAGPVLVVSHGLALATLLCLARQRPLAEAYQTIPDNSHPQVVNWPPIPRPA
jgi:broad specificity phosphatase PhoE